jgi:hypothetical protein
MIGSVGWLSGWLVGWLVGAGSGAGAASRAATRAAGAAGAAGAANVVVVLVVVVAAAARTAVGRTQTSIAQLLPSADFAIVSAYIVRLSVWLGRPTVALNMPCESMATAAATACLTLSPRRSATDAFCVVK